MLRLRFQKELIEAGCDEAGRGCLAGPVFAAAVILPDKFYHRLLNDSKQVPEENRYKLRKVIEKKAIAFAVGVVDNDEIDSINILNASFKAMHLALEKLQHEPQLLLIDGNRFNRYREMPHECIIEGDAKYSAIAAASILAKTYRDDFMRQLHQEFPHYCWYTNKGYATKEHCRAIEQFGLCKYHRKSFDIKAAQLELELF
ncbi:MAG: ribonuclease HII [Bacteroidetes bacterium]|nr:MAG: ribonuclease HII [Bacteroidota bacterium]